MLTAFKWKVQVQEVCQRRMEERQKTEATKKTKIPDNAIIFTFTEPMRARPRPPRIQPRLVSDIVNPVPQQLKYETWEQEAFSRLFRRNSTVLDLMLREVHATYACDWFYLESLHPILAKYKMMPSTTLPLITCQYPLFQHAFLETPWGFHFPYFDTTMFDHGVQLYRLSPRFQLVLQKLQ